VEGEANCGAPRPAGGSYSGRAFNNFADTKGGIPGAAARFGGSVLTSVKVADLWFGSSAVSPIAWAANGFPSLGGGAATFSVAESLSIVASATAVNTVVAGSMFEFGAIAGSLIAALPNPSGSGDVRDALADLLMEKIGPESAAAEMRCGW
jgi:hypothetical protein